MSSLEVFCHWMPQDGWQWCQWNWAHIFRSKITLQGYYFTGVIIRPQHAVIDDFTWSCRHHYKHTTRGYQWLNEFLLYHAFTIWDFFSFSYMEEHNHFMLFYNEYVFSQSITVYLYHFSFILYPSDYFIKCCMPRVLN